MQIFFEVCGSFYQWLLCVMALLCSPYPPRHRSQVVDQHETWCVRCGRFVQYGFWSDNATCSPQKDIRTLFRNTAAVAASPFFQWLFFPIRVHKANSQSHFE